MLVHRFEWTWKNQVKPGGTAEAYRISIKYGFCPCISGDERPFFLYLFRKEYVMQPSCEKIMEYVKDYEDRKSVV